MIKFTGKKTKFQFDVDGKTVDITFMDGKFDKAEFYFTGMYNRQEWNVLGSIDRLIGMIERKYAKMASTSVFPDCRCSFPEDYRM